MNDIILQILRMVFLYSIRRMIYRNMTKYQKLHFRKM
nr:MAG TPA: hypothetical protein [Caudoviricetes sp.]